jgi:protein-S-isoprenylcysteine O-methyltransferase Ste14
VAVLVLIRNFVRFVVEGRGTPSPVLQTERLVVGGDYRFVRNPMYLGVIGAILGQAMIFGSFALLLYALAVWATMATFVRWYEEPLLQNRYGDEYERYRQGCEPGCRGYIHGNDIATLRVARIALVTR